MEMKKKIMHALMVCRSNRGVVQRVASNQAVAGTVRDPLRVGNQDNDTARRRRALRAGELVPFEFHVQAPAEVLVKGRGTVEHVFHARLADAVDGPTTDVLVEGRGFVERLLHRRDARGVPYIDVTPEVSHAPMSSLKDAAAVLQ